MNTIWGDLTDVSARTKSMDASHSRSYRRQWLFVLAERSGRLPRKYFIFIYIFFFFFFLKYLFILLLSEIVIIGPKYPEKINEFLGTKSLRCCRSSTSHHGHLAKQGRGPGSGATSRSKVLLGRRQGKNLKDPGLFPAEVYEENSSATRS